MNKETTWLFITRAQPWLHIGQEDGIRQWIDQWMTKIIIGVGSADKEGTSENPFTFLERKEMLERSAKELLQNIEVEVLAVPDFGDNTQWRNFIFENASDFTYVLTGNENVKNAFKGTDKKIIPIEIRQFVKSSTIRSDLAISNFSAIEKVLPKSVVDYLHQIDAPKRLRDIFNKERKTPSLVVDIVLIDEQGKLILIERGHFPEGKALPGGFNDYGETGAQSAIREAKEELGVDIEIEKELWIRDKPDRDPRGHNVSRAFKAKIVGGKLQAGDDAKRFFEIDPKDIDTLHFAFPDHKEMILAALKW